MRDAGDCYEYIVVYMDDLIVAMKDPKEFFDQLQSPPVNFKLKGVRPASYHLGGDLFLMMVPYASDHKHIQNDWCPFSNLHSKRHLSHLLALWIMRIDPSLTLLNCVALTTLQNFNP